MHFYPPMINKFALAFVGYELRTIKIKIQHITTEPSEYLTNKLAAVRHDAILHFMAVVETLSLYTGSETKLILG